MSLDNLASSTLAAMKNEAAAAATNGVQKKTPLNAKLLGTYPQTNNHATHEQQTNGSSSAQVPTPSSSSATLSSSLPPASSSSAQTTTVPSSSVPSPAPPAALPSPATDESTDPNRINTLNAANVAVLAAQQKKNLEVTAAVTSTLAEKYQTIQAEARKLQLVKDELTKLDQSLSGSIDILRNEIETVNRSLSYLQQDFKEKEFAYLESRKILAKNKQKKLLLTGHLDYIILTNERKKAVKLRELTKALGMNEEMNGVGIAQTTSNDHDQVSDNDELAAMAAEEAEKRKQMLFSGFSEDELSRLNI